MTNILNSRTFSGHFCSMMLYDKDEKYKTVINYSMSSIMCHFCSTTMTKFKMQDYYNITWQPKIFKIQGNCYSEIMMRILDYVLLYDSQRLWQPIWQAMVIPQLYQQQLNIITTFLHALPLLWPTHVLHDRNPESYYEKLCKGVFQVLQEKIKKFQDFPGMMLIFPGFQDRARSWSDTQRKGSNAKWAWVTDDVPRVLTRVDASRSGKHWRVWRQVTDNRDCSKLLWKFIYLPSKRIIYF